MKKLCNLAQIYGRIAKIAAQFSHGLVNSAMGQIPCSTERISSCLKNRQAYSTLLRCIIFGSYAQNVCLHHEHKHVHCTRWCHVANRMFNEQRIQTVHSFLIRRLSLSTPEILVGAVGGHLEDHRQRLCAALL